MIFYIINNHVISMTYTRIIRVVVDNICCWLFFVKNCVLFILSSIFLCVGNPRGICETELLPDLFYRLFSDIFSTDSNFELISQIAWFVTV